MGSRKRLALSGARLGKPSESARQSPQRAAHGEAQHPAELARVAEGDPERAMAATLECP